MRTPDPLYAAVLVLRGSGEVVFVNPGVRALTGLGPGEVWNRRQVLERLFPDEGLRLRAEAALDRAFRAAARRGSLSLQARIPSQDGLVRTWSLQVCSVPDFLGTAFMVSFQPRAAVSEIPAPEDPVAPLREAAREASRRLEQALEAAGSWDRDPRLGRAGTALRRAQVWLATLEAGPHQEAGMAPERARVLGRIG